MTGSLTLSLREAADFTGYSMNIIEAAIQRGDLIARQPPGQLRKNRRINRADLVAWVEQLPAAS